jgi:hypothetical protein
VPNTHIYTCKQRKKTTTELVLAFLQSDTMVEDLLRVMRARDARCASRSAGLTLAKAMLAALRSDEARCVCVLECMCVC